MWLVGGVCCQCASLQIPQHRCRRRPRCECPPHSGVRRVPSTLNRTELQKRRAPFITACSRSTTRVCAFSPFVTGDAQSWQITRCTSAQLPLSIVWPVPGPCGVSPCGGLTSPTLPTASSPPPPPGTGTLCLQQPACWPWRLIEHSPASSSQRCRRGEERLSDCTGTAVSAGALTVYAAPSGAAGCCSRWKHGPHSTLLQPCAASRPTIECGSQLCSGRCWCQRQVAIVRCEQVLAADRESAV
jgi:hypothetical protein